LLEFDFHLGLLCKPVLFLCEETRILFFSQKFISLLSFLILHMQQVFTVAVVDKIVFHPNLLQMTLVHGHPLFLPVFPFCDPGFVDHRYFIVLLSNLIVMLLLKGFHRGCELFIL